jgi:hypothetical protein
MRHATRDTPETAGGAASTASLSQDRATGERRAAARACTGRGRLALKKPRLTTPPAEGGRRGRFLTCSQLQVAVVWLGAGVGFGGDLGDSG